MVVSYHSLPQGVLQAHARTSGNYTWLQNNWEQIYRDYSNQFIAVSNCEVVYHTHAHTELLNYLAEHRDQSDLIGIRVRPHDHILLL